MAYSGAGKGARGAVAPPPNVEKDGPHNSSKFDDKIGGGVGKMLKNLSKKGTIIVVLHQTCLS